MVIQAALSSCEIGITTSQKKVFDGVKEAVKQKAGLLMAAMVSGHNGVTEGETAQRNRQTYMTDATEHLKFLFLFGGAAWNAEETSKLIAAAETLASKSAPNEEKHTAVATLSTQDAVKYDVNLLHAAPGLRPEDCTTLSILLLLLCLRSRV